MKKEYYIPITEIVNLQTQHLMKFGDTSGKGDYVTGGAPERRDPAF